MRSTDTAPLRNTKVAIYHLKMHASTTARQIFVAVTKPLARLLEPLRIATILNIYLSNGM